MKDIKKFLKRKNETIVNLIAMLLIFCFLLTYFTPNLMLSNAITSGGDTASHYYPAEYLKEYLLPKGKIVGWCPGWYAGFPLFQFYFFLPFLITAFLGYVIPLQIAFKIVTILGTFLLPVAAFFSMRMMKFKFPIPIIAAIFTLSFLFMEANSMWGGNIPSTLAGEFSHSLSLALTVLFFGTLYLGLEKNRYILYNSILFTLIILTHFYTALFAALSVVFLLVISKKRRCTLSYLFKMALLAFLLSSFWIIPLFTNIEYTTTYNYVWYIENIKIIFPEILLPFLILALAGIYISLRKKDERVWFFISSLVSSLILYMFANKLGLVDIRFITFLQLYPLFISAYGFSEIISKCQNRFSRIIKINWLIPLIVLFITLYWISYHTTFIAYWIEWNYSGFEGKSLWSTFSAINNFLKGNSSDPRAVYEHSPLHNNAGSLRAFESLPLFSGRSTLEGLYMQSTITSPFIFYIQSEISKDQSCPLPGYACSRFNLDMGTKHLEMFNVKYFIAITEEVKAALRNDENYKLLKIFDDYEIYELKTNLNKYVVVPKYNPILFQTDDWKKVSYEWFKNYELIDTPLVFVSKINPEDSSRFIMTSNNLANISKVPIDANCSIEETVSNEEVKIKTNCIGKPHIIRISYYPNWKVEGAEKIYLVSPSFMMIIPEKEDVRIYYGKTFEDTLGEILTYIGIGAILFIILLRSQRLKRFVPL